MKQILLVVYAIWFLSCPFFSLGSVEEVTSDAECFTAQCETMLVHPAHITKAVKCVEARNLNEVVIQTPVHLSTELYHQPYIRPINCVYKTKESVPRGP